MNFGNHRYTNEQDCILFICKCDIKIICRANFFLPPNPKTVPTALYIECMKKVYGKSIQAENTILK